MGFAFRRQCRKRPAVIHLQSKPIIPPQVVKFAVAAEGPPGDDQYWLPDKQLLLFNV